MSQSLHFQHGTLGLKNMCIINYLPHIASGNGVYGEEQEQD